MPDRPVKILHVVYFLEPGGMENGIVNIANALDGNGFDIHCCCLERPGAFVERLHSPEKIHVLGKKGGFSLRTGWDLAALVRRLKPDFLHSHNLGPLIYSALGTTFGLSCRVIQGEHSLLTPEECSRKRLRQRKWLYHACREVHTVSTQLKDQLVSLGFGEKRISVIPNGVDTDRFVPSDASAARKQIGLGNIGSDAVVLGIVGRFGKFKRHNVLLEAFSSLAKDYPQLHLVVVGDGGPEKDRVRQQAASSPFASRIHLTGFQQDVRPFYQALDLLVVPSENEGMSNAVLEGMSCGVPVLAHQVCGNSEIIKHRVDGWISDLHSVEKLAAELKNILAVPLELAKMKQMARAKALKDFSIGSMVEQYASLYRRHARQH